MVRNIFRWVWIFDFYIFPQEEPNSLRRLGGGIFAFMASKRSWNPSRKLGRLLSSLWPLKQIGPPKKVFWRGVLSFLLGSIFKELILLMWLLGVYNKCCKSLDLKPLGDNQNLACMKKMEGFYKWFIRFNKLMLRGIFFEKTLWWAL